MNYNIRQIGALFLMIISLFLLSACQNILEEVTVTSIELETSTFNSSYDIDDFNLSNISIRVSFSDGKFQIIPITESMLSNEHIQLLSNVGQHQITITYEGKTTTITINLSYDTLKTQLMSIYALATTQGGFEGTYEEWLLSIKGDDGLSIIGATINENGHLILTLSDDSTIDSGKVVPENAKEVEFQTNETHIQWRYIGDDTWFDLITLESLKGLKGDDGVNGKEVEFRVNEISIQWRYVNEENWSDLVLLSYLVGPKGEQGKSITNTTINEIGELIVTYSDDTTQNLGAVLRVYVVSFKNEIGYVLDTQLVLHGTNAVAPNPPTKEGYSFKTWDKDYTNVLSNLEVKAIYEINKYSVTFNTNGGSTHESINDVEYGSVISLPVPVKEGYDFLGWYQSESLTASPFYEDSKVTKDLVLNARWQLKNHEIKFLDFDDKVLYSQLVIHGMSAHAPNNPHRVGYTFSGWDLDFSNVVESLIIRALYVPINYTISFNSNQGSLVESISQGYETQLPNLPIPVLIGHDFKGWFQDHEMEIVFASTSMPLNGITLYAKWELSKYLIIFDTNEGSELANLQVTYGDVINSLPEPTRTDFIFDGWLYNDELLTLPYIYTLESDLTLTAKWKGLAEGVNFELQNSEITILSYTGQETSLILPDTIGGYPIKSIAPEAFMSNTSLEEVKLGQYVTSIGNSAFSNMVSLKTISLPNSAKTIGSSIFYGSNALEKIVISSEATYELRYYFGNNINFVPSTLLIVKYASGANFIDKTLTQNNMKGVALELADGTKTISANQFENSQYLTEIIIPASVEVIDAWAFNNNPNLVKVTFKENSNLSVISYGAFKGASSLEQIIIPSSVSVLRNMAFENNFKLKVVTFEEGSKLSTIENDVFKNNQMLEQIYFPKSLYVIGQSAFQYSGLKYIEFETGSNLREIRNKAFEGTKLETINLPEGLYSIGHKAFYLNYENLEEVYIPLSVQQISSDAFVSSVGVIYVKVGQKPSGWDDNWCISPFGVISIVKPSIIWGFDEIIDNGTIKYTVSSNNTVSILGLSDVDYLVDLIIPEYINGIEVTEIVPGAFRNSEYLNSIIIPSTITIIRQYTFDGASNLSKVLFSENSQITVFSSGAFSNTPSLKYLDIPLSVTTIDGSFQNTGISNFYIPSSVITISSGSFRDNNNYKIISVAVETKPNGWSSGWNNRGIYGDPHNTLWGVLSQHIANDLIFAVLSNNEVSVVGINPNSSSELIIIPEIFNELPVTTIESRTFQNNKYIKDIVIHGGISLIRDFAFLGCDNLVIYLENTSIPVLWELNWNYSNCPIYLYDSWHVNDEGVPTPN